MNKKISPTREVQSFGQSIWYDNIRREMISSGELQSLIEDGIKGITSNPTIFEKAIVGSQDYDDDLRVFSLEGLSPEQIFEELAIADIRNAADLLYPIYRQENGHDGFVSLEVRPTLAYDTEGTINEARRLFKKLGRPNVMIKVPATSQGLTAVETLISEGININVTLIFSIEQYEAVVNAYIAGLKNRSRKAEAIENVASVASFFLSRIDTAVDGQLELLGQPALKGKIAIASAEIAYERFRNIFSGELWESLSREGAQVQRPLWASTGTKNPAYRDTLYVESLIGPDTVNTVPPATLAAFNDHGNVSLTLGQGLAQAVDEMSKLKATGVDLDAITAQLLEEGVEAFTHSYTTLIQSIIEKQSEILNA